MHAVRDRGGDDGEQDREPEDEDEGDTALRGRRCEGLHCWTPTLAALLANSALIGSAPGRNAIAAATPSSPWHRLRRGRARPPAPACARRCSPRLLRTRATRAMGRVALFTSREALRRPVVT